MFDVATGKQLTSVDGGPPIAVAVTASGVGRLATTVPGTLLMTVRQLPEGQPLFDIPNAAAIAFSPDGAWIAGAGGTDGIGSSTRPPASSANG